jgi:hypothetical protein
VSGGPELVGDTMRKVVYGLIIAGVITVAVVLMVMRVRSELGGTDFVHVSADA